MLTQISIRNFKCIDNSTLRLAPITLLAGLNGAGKSSLIQSLLTIRQSHQSGVLLQGYLQTSGDLVDLGTPGDVLYEGAETDLIEISVRDSANSELPVQFKFIVAEGGAIAKAPDFVLHQKALNVASGLPTTALMLTGLSPQTGGAFFHYLNAERLGPRKYGPIPSFRGREYNLGTKGEFALHALYQHRNDAFSHTDDLRILNQTGSRLGDQVEAWLAEVSPGVSLDLAAVEQADLMVGSFSFAEPGELRSREFRATNVGFGLSYVLPVIVALLSCEEGGVVLLENPEAHIHPAGQTRLGELCAFAAASGVQVIVETHSDHFMDGIRIAVRNGFLSPDECAFHYFQRAGTRSEVTSPELDRSGKLSAWPAGFFDQHRRNTAKLVKPL
jgi:predicted ATPase